MAKIELEWGEDFRGKRILLAKKKRGKISIAELQEAMNYNHNYSGAWAVIFRVFEDGGYIGWGDLDVQKGDVLELYQLGEGEGCPVCDVVLIVEYCPHCGECLKVDGKK